MSVPEFQVTKNKTTYTFLDIAKGLGSGILVVPFVSILGNVAIAKAFGTIELNHYFNDFYNLCF